MNLNTAEKDALTDGAIVFLGSLGVTGVGATIVPAIAPMGIVGALVAGAIAGLNTYRKDSALPATA